MSDLIRREDAIEALKEYEVVESDNFTRIDPVSMMTVATIANCIEAIVELPSAEPEREKGEWMMHSDYSDRLICSECTGQFDVWHWESKQMHFCPNCGAEMTRGEYE